MASPSSVPSGASFVGSTRPEYAGTKTSLGLGSMVPVTKKLVTSLTMLKVSHIKLP